MPPTRLVIVESPAKAKTIAGYLGEGYEVDASVGHIRDLASKASELPEALRKKPWAKYAVDVDDAFQPVYVVHPDKKQKITELKRKLKDADELLLATDEDREGEAIAWHLIEVLKPKVPVRRMVFNEITKDAIQRAADNTRDLDMALVDAQETRRIVDRLYGYPVSEVLWRKIGREARSAGRVQSVAVRLVVDRERERMAFVSAGYWSITGTFDPEGFAASLVQVDGARVATGNDFDDSGRAKRGDVLVLDEVSARGLVDALQSAAFAVRSVEETPGTKRPNAPFMTSTLQREASTRFRWGAQRTMRVAQGLYERGYITYMRTDSISLSEQAITAARAQATELFGPDYVPSAPRAYAKKVKNAQEAHEAIRPAGDRFRTPAQVAGELVGDDFALYELIWKRTIASQMVDARTARTTIRLGTRASDGRDVEFSASGTVIVFAGFLAAMDEVTEDDDDESARRLPRVAEGDPLGCTELEPRGHATSPPRRYSEASLVKALEDRGIGRPSTYASIMSTILDRGYVWKRGTALVPSFAAFAVVRLLEEHFSDLIDYDFTARMEETLDLISAGESDRVAELAAFWRGRGGSGAATGGAGTGDDFPGVRALTEDLSAIDAREISTFPIAGSDAVLRVGKYGPYIELGETRANLPPDLAPDELTADKAQELLSRPSGDRELGVDPQTGLTIVAKVGRYGPYVSEVLPEDAPKAAKPRMASIFKDMDVTTVTLDDALRLLSLPRVVGADPADGVEITAQNGRYGPYISKGKDSRSLPDEPSIFSVTLEEALAILAQPKTRRGAAAPKGPLRELGTDPISGKDITLREGRFGPYVTDGEVNASLRRADNPETLTLERASDLLSEKRAAGPAPKKATRKKASTARR